MSLDPEDWSSFREQAHRMLDDMIAHVEHVRARPLWQRPPSALASAALPLTPADLEAVHDDFMSEIQPFGSGNLHPGFLGWAQGGGTLVGALGEMMAAGLNANVGGRHHAAVLVEQQVSRWMQEAFGFPSTATGLFMTGASQANFLAVLAARRRKLGASVRRRGLQGAGLTAYASREVHGCVRTAFDMAGLGSDALRLIETDDARRLDVQALSCALARDREEGLTPFLIVATAGSVNTGSIDPLPALVDVARSEGLWLHVDGAIGAPCALSETLAPLFEGLSGADSIAMDFHKLAQVPYDAGYLLCRERQALYDAFASPEAYLTRAEEGLAAGDFWPCDHGPDLSRGFRALKVWYTLRTFGLVRLGAVAEKACRLAQAMAAEVRRYSSLELLAPPALNVVCFRYNHAASDVLNRRIVERLHQDGGYAPSVTLIDGRPVIRAAVFNHRTELQDVLSFVRRVAELGDQLASATS